MPLLFQLCWCYDARGGDESKRETRILRIVEINRDFRLYENVRGSSSRNILKR